MLVLILVLGVYPQLLFEVIDPAVTDLVGRLETYIWHRDRVAPRPGRPTGVTPTIDWHAIAPELVLIVGINLVLATDLLHRREPGSGPRPP